MTRERWLRLASVLALIGLALMVWSVLQPTPLPVLVALTAGQAIGTASFAILVAVVVADLGVARKLRGRRDDR